MAFDVQHDPSAHRFTHRADDATSELDYRLSSAGTDTTMTITHTFVPAAARGHGIAGELVHAAVEMARAQGWRVVPACSYADAWMRRHPEFSGLRD